MIDANLPWYVVRCNSGDEEKCWLELRTGGLEAYFPRSRRRVLNRKARIPYHRTAESAAMLGYVFVAGESIDWGVLAIGWGNEHVGRPLRDGTDGPKRIPGAIVLQISLDEAAGAFDETGATKKANHAKLTEQFPRGKRVRPTEGPLSGFAAFVDAVTPKARLRVLVDVFGRMVPVEFDVEQLDAA